MVSASSLLIVYTVSLITGMFLILCSIFSIELSKVSSAELCPQHGQKKALPITAYLVSHSMQVIFRAISMKAGTGRYNDMVLFQKH